MGANQDTYHVGGPPRYPPPDDDRHGSDMGDSFTVHLDVIVPPLPSLCSETLD